MASWKQKHTMERREFIRHMLQGTAGVSLAAIGSLGCGAGLKSTQAGLGESVAVPGDAAVSLVPGNDRREIVRASLLPFQEQIARDIQGKQVLIKLNCVRRNQEKIGTHRDSLFGVLDFLKPIYDRPVFVGEATADNEVDARGVYDHFGYTAAERDFNVNFVELNDNPTTKEWILDADMYPQPIGVLRPFTDPDVYLISLTKIKTHNVVIATLTLKNVVMGAPIKILSRRINEKTKMHANDDSNNSPKMLNFNLFRLAHRVRPDLCVLDGFEGLEGNGPNSGDLVPSHVALAGFDTIAVDRIGLELMGIPWENIGYLQYCATGGLGQGDLDRIRIIGPDPAQYVKQYRLHDEVEWMYRWKDDLVVELPR